MGPCAHRCANEFRYGWRTYRFNTTTAARNECQLTLEPFTRDVEKLHARYYMRKDKLICDVRLTIGDTMYAIEKL